MMNSVFLLLPWTVVLVLLLEPATRLTGGSLWSVIAGFLLWLAAGWRPLRGWLNPLRPWLALGAILLGGWQLAQLAQARFAPWALSFDRVYMVEGTIDGLPEQDRFGTRLRLKVDCVSAVETTCDLYQRRHPFWPLLVDVTAGSNKWPQPPLPGQRWRFFTHVAPSHQQDPFDSFNLARWLKSSHVVARFKLKSSDTALQLDESTAPLQMARLKLRQAVQGFQEQAGAQSGLSGLPVVLALITGDRALMTQEHWRIFNNTGTTHLVAISGSHIMLVTAVVVGLFHLLLRRWLWLTQRVPSLTVAMLLGWLVAIAYGGIAGLGFPVQRALIMLSMVVLFKGWGRAQPLWLAWNLAFFLVVLWDPMAVFSIGFWLSFIAVYWILWVSGGSVLKTSKWLLWARVQWGIFLGLAPVLLWQLQNLSLVSGGTNAFAIPLIGLVLTPLSLLWALLWSMLGDSANVLLWPAKWLAEGAIWLLQWCADTPVSVLTTTPHSAGAMLLALLGVVWLCTAGIPARWLAPLLLLPLVLPAPSQPGMRVMTGATSPRVLIDSGHSLQLVSASEWPRLDTRWQQNWLRYLGIAPPGPDVPVHGAAEFWNAPHWVLTTLELDSNWLGIRRVAAQAFVDLCSGSGEATTSLRWQVLQRHGKSGRCTLLLQWQNARLLLLDAPGLKDQQALLEHLRQQSPLTHVLLHPRQQDRWLPALLQFWRQKKVQLLLTQSPDEHWREPFDSAGLTVQVLAESGPVFLAPAHP